MKRSHTGGARVGPRDDSGEKVDRQELWDVLQRRAEQNEPFTAGDLAPDVGAPEAAVAKHLVNLAFERMIEKVDGGKYRAGPVKNTNQAEFNKALAAKVDPKRIQDQVEIERLKKNNDEMRRRLLDAVAERDRYLKLLEKHGIDPTEAA